jgi:phage replication-related protein YjqB (UPF0714/DUF867 family)
MATYDASIRKARPTQEGLKADREHCSADPERLAAIGVEAGQQVRIRRSDAEYALFTVSEACQERPDVVVRMGAAGRERLGTSDEFEAVVSSEVPNPTMTQTQARKHDELIERLTDDGVQRDLIAIAPHGGQIELHTDQQAQRVASRLAVSSWRCKGYKHDQGAFARWHITSTDIAPVSFPLLASVMSRGFAHAVAFHGFDDPEVAGDVLVGGIAPDTFKEDVRCAVQDAVGVDFVVRIPGPEENLGGDDPCNIVNRLTGGTHGIQLEQSPRVRARRWREIADALAELYRREAGAQHGGRAAPSLTR